LVVFANFAAMAEEQGHSLINCTFHSYASLFEATRRDIYCRYPVAKRRSLWDAVPGASNVVRSSRVLYHASRAASGLQQRWSVGGKSMVTLGESPGQLITALDCPEVQETIRDAKVIFVNGWNFRAPTWVERHAEALRQYFRPVAEFEQAAGSVVESLRREADVVVGVHIRHGDYRTWKNGCYFYDVERYVRWMHELTEQYPGRSVAFFVCSDEPRTPQEFRGLTVGLGAGSPLGDLTALAKCDCLFGPMSTFSQWASFYGNKPLFQLPDGNASLETSNFRVSLLREIP